MRQPNPREEVMTGPTAGEIDGEIKRWRGGGGVGVVVEGDSSVEPPVVK